MLKKNLRQLKAESNKRDTELYSTMLSGKGKGATPATKVNTHLFLCLWWMPILFSVLSKFSVF